MGFFNFNKDSEKDLFSTMIFSSRAATKISAASVMTIPAAKAAIELISSTIAQLPIYLYSDENSQMNKIENDSVAEMLAYPSRYETASTLKKKLATDYLLLGKAYCYRKGNDLVYLSAVNVDETSYTLDNISVEKKEFKYSGSGATILLDETEVLVIDSGTNGLLVDGGDIFKLAVAQIEFEANLMANGALPIGVLKASSRLTEAAITRLRSSWAALYTGQKNAGKTIILEEGLEYSKLALNPDELQLGNAKKAIVSEIARLFNIPESMINSAANKYASNEQNNIYFYQNTLSPIITAFEESFDNFLLSDRAQYLRFDTSELIRSTEAERIENVSKAFKDGLIDFNEARYKLELPKVDEAENYKIFGLASVMEYSDKSISIPNLGIIRNKVITQEVPTNDGNTKL